MANENFFVVRDGAQLEGQYSQEQVKQMMVSSPGANFLIWKEGMAQWSKPETLPGFEAAYPPAATPPSAPPPSAPPAPAPAPGMGEQARQGGRAVIQGAAAHFDRMKQTSDPLAYLPHLKWINALLGWVAGLISRERLDFVDDWSKKFGHIALLAAAVFMYLFGAIFGIKSSDYMSLLKYLLVFPIAVIAQFAAVKFLDAGKSLIEKSPSALSSKSFLECLGLLMLLGVIGALGGGIFGAIGGDFTVLFGGLGGALMLTYVLGVTLNSQAVNVDVTGDASAGQEALAIAAFFLKLILRLVPVGFGVACVVGALRIFVDIFKLFGDQAFGAFMDANSSFAMVMASAVWPFLAYLVFVILYLLNDIARSILVVPGKLDHLAGDGKD